MEMVAIVCETISLFCCVIIYFTTLLPIFNIKSFNSFNEELESNLYFIFDMDRFLFTIRQLFYIIIFL